MTEWVALPSVEHIMEVTKFKRRSLAESAIETYKWLAEGAPEKFNGFSKPVIFDMSVALEEIYDDAFYHDDVNICGSVCCIAGTIYLHNQKHNKKKVDYENFDIFEYFDIDNGDELDQLFFPGNYYGKGPNKSARVLLHYLWTGQTDWSL